MELKPGRVDIEEFFGNENGFRKYRAVGGKMTFSHFIQAEADYAARKFDATQKNDRSAGSTGIGYGVVRGYGTNSELTGAFKSFAEENTDRADNFEAEDLERYLREAEEIGLAKRLANGKWESSDPSIDLQSIADRDAEWQINLDMLKNKLERLDGGDEFDPSGETINAPVKLLRKRVEVENDLDLLTKLWGDENLLIVIYRKSSRPIKIRLIDPDPDKPTAIELNLSEWEKLFEKLGQKLKSGSIADEGTPLETKRRWRTEWHNELKRHNINGVHLGAQADRIYFSTDQALAHKWGNLLAKVNRA